MVIIEIILSLLFTILMFLFCSIAIILNMHKKEIWNSIKFKEE